MRLSIRAANDAIMATFQRDLAALTTSDRLSNISTTLTSIMPERHPREHLIRAEELCRLPDVIFASTALEILLYLVSNNLHPRSKEFDRQFMDIFKVSGLMERTVRSILSSKAPTTQAFAEKLYGMASRTADTNLLATLLKAGMDPNLRIAKQYVWFKSHYHWTITALEASIVAENTETLQLLLRHGADVCGIHLRAAENIASLSSRRNIVRLLLPRLNLSSTSQRDLIDAVFHLISAGDHETAALLLAEMWRRCAQLSLAAKITVLIAAILYRYDEIINSLLETGIDVSVTVSDERFRKFSALWAAVTTGSHHSCERLLKKGVPPDTIIEFPYPATCLQYAAKIGDVKMIELLLKYGADINHYHTDGIEYSYFEGEFYFGRFGETALESAICGRQTETAMWLQAAGAKSSGRELVISIMRKLPQLVEHFLDGVECRLSEEKQLLCVQAAIASGQLELAKRFLGICGQLSREAKGACIRTAIRHRQLGFADLIIEGEYNPDLLCAAVHMAVLTKDTSHVLSLLRRRQRYTDLGASCLLEGTALGICINTGDLELIKILISHGIHSDSGIEQDKNKRQNISDLDGNRKTVEDWACSLGWWISENYSTRSWISPLAMAVDAGCEKTVIFLLEHGYEPCPTAFCRAARLGQAGMLQALLAVKPSLIAQPPDSQTALALAIGNRKMEIVEFLLRAGADVNPSPPSDYFLYRVFTDFLSFFIMRTPLQAAVEIGDAKLVELLLKKGADVNAPPGHQSGATALQFAAICGYMGIAKMLIASGADCNASGAYPDGRTALEGAAEHGRLDMLQLLLESGAMTDGPGRLQYFEAIKLARYHGHFAAANLLESYRAWTREDDCLWGKIDKAHPGCLRSWLNVNEGWSVARTGKPTSSVAVSDNSSEEFNEEDSDLDFGTDDEREPEEGIEADMEDVIRETEESIRRGGQVIVGEDRDVVEDLNLDLHEGSTSIDQILCAVSAEEDWFEQFVTFSEEDDRMR
jgi:ankyrin repeat protein